MNDVLNGRFSIIEIISEDRLYKTVDTATGSLVAVKKWKSGDQSYEKELSALTSFRHPSVPCFICNFEEEGCQYIAEEWLDGMPPERNLSWEALKDFAISAASFLSFLATDVENIRIHGDIKPSNLIVKEGRVCFIDFESSIITRIYASDSNAPDAAFQINRQKIVRLSSESFSAPEIFYGRACVQSDIYSLGMVLAWMLDGVDMNRADLYRIPNDCPLKSIVTKCIAFDIQDRYQNAEELLSDLNQIKKIPQINLSSAQPYNPAVRFSLYVDCNVCFAWELAGTAASSFGMKTCILALTDRTQRKLDYYTVNDKYYGEESVEEDTQPYLFDYRSLYKRDAEAWHAKGLIHRREDCGNLYYSGNRLPDELEADNELCITDLAEWGNINFDCIIFITDRYDDKSAVKNLTANCGYTIATPLANIDDIEACKNYYERFGGNVLYAAWEFNAKCSLPEESIMLMVGEDKYLGAVSHDDERNYKRNFVGKIRPIFHPDGNENNKQYINIINHLFNAACNRKERTCVSV